MALEGENVSARRWQETGSEGSVSVWRCWLEADDEGCKSAEYKVLHGRH